MNTISDEMHRLRGTRPTRADKKPSTFEGGRPRMPKYLSDIAQEKWREVVRLLAKRSTLTRADATALEILCVTYERWRALCDEIRRYGPMVDTTVGDNHGEREQKRVQNPACKLAAQLENSMRAMLKELSATPASREKSKPASPEKPPKVEKTPQEQEYESFAALVDR